MVAVTYGVARVTAAGKRRAASTAKRAEAAAPRKSWFARFMDALIEARMQQARREIAHAHPACCPTRSTNAATGWSRPAPSDMPFGGW